MQQDKAPITEDLIKSIYNTTTTSIEGAVTVVENANKKLNRDNYERYKIRDFYKQGSIIRANDQNGVAVYLERHLLE